MDSDKGISVSMDGSKQIRKRLEAVETRIKGINRKSDGIVNTKLILATDKYPEYVYGPFGLRRPPSWDGGGNLYYHGE